MNSVNHAAGVRILSIEFFQYYITTMRPYLLFVSGITGIVGVSFVPNLSIITSALIVSSSFLSYGFGQALTDCFQIDTDSLSAPYRPLTQGLISKTQVMIVSIVGLVSCVSIFAVYNPINVMLGVVSGLGLATYTPFKRRWWGGPFYNSWIVALLCAMAFLVGGKTLLALFSTPFVFVLLTVFFGYANFVLAGYFKDIEADRATAYNTLPVVFGKKAAVLVSDFFAALTITFAMVSWLQAPGSALSHFVAAHVALGGVVTSAVAQFRLHNVASDNEAHRAISLVVHSYILLLSSIALLQKSEWQGPVILFYGSFVMVMNMRPARNQV